jgi:hypothetical protein
MIDPILMRRASSTTGMMVKSKNSLKNILYYKVLIKKSDVRSLVFNNFAFHINEYTKKRYDLSMNGIAVSSYFPY